MQMQATHEILNHYFKNHYILLCHMKQERQHYIHIQYGVLMYSLYYKGSNIFMFMWLTFISYIVHA
jgi:hypothetical protein